MEAYAARVDAVLAQRTRFRGPQPEGDLFAGLPAGHPLLNADPHGPLGANLQAIAAYLEPEDILVDVGGGAGRISLPLALRCREVVNVDPSAAMGAAFVRNASRASLTNVRFVEGDWLNVEPPGGTVALVNHVTYFVREIRPFIEKLEQAGPRRVLITVNAPPPPSSHGRVYELVYGEPQAMLPGHAELANVLWEMGILPDVLVLPDSGNLPSMASPTREEAIAAATVRFNGAHWAFWPQTPAIEQRTRTILAEHFADLFIDTGAGYVPGWLAQGREILITWRPSIDRLSRDRSQF